MRKINRIDLLISTIMSNWLWVVVSLTVIMCFATDCCGNDINPLDNSINKSREVVEHVIVTDSTNNGFRLIYATKNSVTKERLEEIRSRKQINEVFEHLKKDAPIHFGDLLNTDIYDFAEFAIHYDVDSDIQLHNIIVEGYDKCRLYIGPNPKIDNPAVFFNTGTQQGAQYISNKDIYYCRRKDDRIYRYWKCYGINATSCTDEHYSHFSEDERLW